MSDDTDDTDTTTTPADDDGPSAAFVREQLVRDQRAWMARHARRDGRLTDVTEQTETLLIRASQLISMGMASPYAVARLWDALRLFGPTMERARDSLTFDRLLESWWPLTLLPVDGQYRPYDPANRQPPPVPPDEPQGA